MCLFYKDFNYPKFLYPQFCLVCFALFLDRILLCSSCCPGPLCIPDCLGLLTLMAWPPKCWDCMHASPHHILYPFVNWANQLQQGCCEYQVDWETLSSRAWSDTQQFINDGYDFQPGGPSFLSFALWSEMVLLYCVSSSVVGIYQNRECDPYKKYCVELS